ncbi:MAG TPA: cysteine desulfurase [Balneolales bacterium]|nr:cysteine desulfurase [Balneolales bacterium]
MSTLTNVDNKQNSLLKDWDVEQFRSDFPVLNQMVNDSPLIYFDNAASSQMPQKVIDRLVTYHSHEHANVHRGIHYLSQKATTAFEEARTKVQHFIGASDSSEIIWTSGTTDSINLVAQTYGRSFMEEGDEIIISEMEHHANIVSWQILCDQNGAKLKVIPIDDNGDLILEEYEKLLNDRTKIVAITHISNVLGTINPVKKVIERAHSKGVPVLLDGAQSAPHMPVNVQDLDCDFYAFSGHKMHGPTGIGVLYGKKEWLDQMPPYRGGGEMIDEVTFEKTTYNDLPFKFEAGTPSIAASIALGTAIDYLNEIGMDRIAAYEDHLLDYATKKLQNLDGIKIVGTAKEKSSIISFMLDDIHPHDVGTLLDQQGIAIRTGHHCAQPLMTRFNIPATSRASFALFNTEEEIDKLVEGLRKVKKIFA